MHPISVSYEIVLDRGAGVVAGSRLTTVGDAWGDGMSRVVTVSPHIVSGHNQHSLRVCALPSRSTPVP